MSSFENTLKWIVKNFRGWYQNPVPYTEYSTNLIEECKVGFGNVIRAEIVTLTTYTWSVWLSSFWPIIGWFFVLTGIFNPLGSHAAWMYGYGVPKLDANYECLRRNGVAEFSQENFDTEYWFQKGFIEEYSEKTRANPKPTYQSAKAAEMIVFYEGMLEYYGLPLTM